MKVLFISNSSAGMLSFRREIVARFAVNADVFLCAQRDIETDYWGDINCTFIPYSFNNHGINPIREFKHILYYKSLIKTINPDLVITYTIKPNIYGGLICAKMNKPHIASITGLGDAVVNGGLIKTVIMKLYKYSLRKTSCVFFQNEANRVFFINSKVVSGRTRLTPGSGVNIGKFLYSEYPRVESPIRFLFIARIKKEKGIEELLRAIRIVREEREDCFIDVLGNYEQDYSKEIQDAQSRGDVLYHGYQENNQCFYSICHCVILPSYHEGTSNVLLEGAAMGRPIIASSVPGCMETFEEGITGFGCKVKDVASLVLAMKKFLSLPADQKRIMGVKAREKMLREFNREIVVNSYLEEAERAVNLSD